MANRNNRRANGIRGPQSALTDFLASHNISAQQISLDHQRRLDEARRQEEQNAAAAQVEEPQSDEDEDPVERKKRKRKEEMAIMKIKQSKEFKRRKYENGDDEDDEAIARQMLKKAQPMPGQLENCDECSKRFTVTPYSKTGPGGGLLCGKCSKGMKDEEKKAQASQKKKVAPKSRRRQTESDRMMGDVQPGAKSLVEQCVSRVADVVHDVEEFGDLPQSLLDRLSQILSKKRIMTSRTLQLFLQPGIDRISIYDCGKLETEDFQKIFAFMPDLEVVNLRFAGQMKDESIRYMIEKNHHIQHLQLGATNLITDSAWTELFKQRGPQLKSLKLSELNDSLNDESVVTMGKYCTNLTRLKLRSCSKMTEASIEAISRLTRLEHLSLAVAQHVPAEVLVELIKGVGPNLKTLSLEDYVEADDTVLEAIRNNCTQLTKLRFTGTSLCTDNAFAELLKHDTTRSPLLVADLSMNRDTANANPCNDCEDVVGFGSAALKALMSQSGGFIKRLDLHSCRHISHEAFLDVFDGQKRYGSLRDIDLSFCTYVDDVTMAGIFKSCPKLNKLAVFACFSARGVEIPAGIAVVGLPSARGDIVINGDAMLDIEPDTMYSTVSYGKSDSLVLLG